MTHPPSVIRNLRAVCITVLALTVPTVGQPGPDLDAWTRGVRGYVYVEPFEIRNELTVPMAMLPGADAASTIPEGEARDATLAALGNQLRDACRLRADGEAVVPEVERAQFIVIDPVRGPMPDDREQIAVADALVGVVYATARRDFPKRLDIEWTLFPSGRADEVVPVELEVMSGEDVHTETLEFDPSQTARSWMLPELAPAPRLRELAPVSTDTRVGPYVVIALLGLAAFGLAGYGLSGRTGDRPSVFTAAGLSLLLAGGVLYDARTRPSASRLTEMQARGVIEGLLENIYHAFSHRSESVIFDTLAHSVQGPLLEQLYLDIRRGLVLEESGGPRVKVLRVAVIDCAVLGATDGQVRARVVWASAGDVSHWGHTHRRRNQYRGELLIEADEGRWKVKDVNILSEERTEVAIRIENLRFRYPSERFELAVDDLYIGAGEPAAIIGPSGCGKTTLLRLIAGILRPHAGSVRVFESEMSELGDARARAFRIRNIGLVFQEFELLEYLTAAENILLPFHVTRTLRLDDDARTLVHELAERTGITHLLESYPRQCSQGERQRVAICRALVTRPRLVLADEPTGSLDPANQARIVELLRTTADAAGAGLIMVTHDHQLLAQFEHVVDLPTVTGARA